MPGPNLPVSALQTFLRDEGRVVRVIEHVEHFKQHIHPRAADDLEMLLDAHIRAVNWRPNEVVAWDDRAVGSEAAAAATGSPRIAAVRRGVAEARPVEVHPAHLDSMTELPNGVDDGTVALIGGRQPPFAS